MTTTFRIKELRKAKGLTQTQLANAVGLGSPATVCQWESGKNAPVSTMLPDIAKALGCTIDQLYMKNKLCEEVNTMDSKRTITKEDSRSIDRVSQQLAKLQPEARRMFCDMIRGAAVLSDFTYCHAAIQPALAADARSST